MKTALGVVAALAASLAARPALAQGRELPPFQANGGLLVGVAGQGSGELWGETLFHGGLRGDMLFGRTGSSSWGYGLNTGLSTTHFRDINLGGGGTLLFPVHDYLPLILHAGPYARWTGSLTPGVYGALFWGGRSYNFHGTYNAGGGVAIEGRYGLGDDKERTVIITAHIDAGVALIPVFFLINAFR